MATIYWTILVTVPEYKRALRLAPDGTLTMRRVHAAMISDKAKADRYAAEINRDHADDGISARVAAF